MAWSYKKCFDCVFVCLFVYLFVFIFCLFVCLLYFFNMYKIGISIGGRLNGVKSIG